ncbi:MULTISPECIES: hypothetical protein [unclassified Roseovarius]|jgi:hypothetical protein|uniref:hypothetical protein n=1 Tax=unclassified Roseovarius TaxID=2614913 RepID=UPI0000687D9F|nr:MULTISPECIES: hypothetical protein [unclassified Roseovarius]EAQ24243.1 hypothetical protein ROS217_11901 [Roseovarius sp. 217]KJS40653.1 MAG: hypothetical protein VR71_21920 [Roseovarius sp. BRH_c41]
MLALMRLLIFGLIVLTLLYLGISWYSRSQRRQKMEHDWEEAGRPGDREAYIEAGMIQYQHSLRRRLILLVYIVPVTTVAVVIYMTNFR